MIACLLCDLLCLLCTQKTSLIVPPIVATKHPLEWTEDREDHTLRVLPSGCKGWTCIACGDRAGCECCALHSFGGPHEDCLTMDCATYTIKSPNKIFFVFFFLAMSGGGWRRGKPAHDQQGVNSYVSDPAEAVFGREYHVPPRATRRRTFRPWGRPGGMMSVASPGGEGMSSCQPVCRLARRCLVLAPLD